MITQPHYDDAKRLWVQPDEKIDADLGWGIVQLPVADLECRMGGEENDHEWNAWIEYRLNGRLVHRSARTHIKTGVFAEGFQGSF